MLINLKTISKNNFLEIGQKCFNLGLFFLPTILPISLTFLFIALIISISINKINFINDKWNLFLFFSSGIIIFNSINVLISSHTIYNLDNYLIIIFNALKWIILFILFAGFQFYLKTNIQRINFGRILLFGSVPIIFSCIMQYWFKIYGPFEFLNGLIVFYNKPITGPADGVSGLFSNQNYTGFWLSVIWPFCVYFLSKHRTLDLKKFLLILLNLFTIYIVFMTTSRASILGLLISLPIIFSLKLVLKIILILVFIYLIFSFIPESLISQNDIYLPKTIKILIGKFLNFNINDLQNITRIKIWNNTFKFILSKPILGYGAGLFPLIYLGLNDYNAQHAHNIILQIAFDYGIFLAIALTLFVIVLLYKASNEIFTNSKKLNINGKPIEIYWFASALVAVISQIYDVTFFEGRVSIIVWLLLVGLKSIIDENHNKQNKFIK